MDPAGAIVDTGGTIFFILFGIEVAIVVFLVGFVVEAILLRLLKWDSFWRCVFDSLIINLVSLLPGVGMIMLSFFQPAVLAILSEISSG